MSEINHLNQLQIVPANILSHPPEFFNPAMLTDEEVAKKAEYCLAIKKLRSICSLHIVTDREFAFNEKFCQKKINSSLVGSVVAHGTPEWFVNSMQEIHQELAVM